MRARFCPLSMWSGGLTPSPEPWSHHSCSPLGAFCIPLYVPYVLTGRWTFGRGLCKLWLVVDYLLCASSVFNIVLISYDRFLSVTRAVSSGMWELAFTLRVGGTGQGMAAGRCSLLTRKPLSVTINCQ